MADKILVTTGSGLEGYSIVEYLGFVSSQAILGSNFISGIAANMTDVARKDTAKLEQCREDAGKQLIKAAENRNNRYRNSCKGCKEYRDKRCSS